MCAQTIFTVIDHLTAWADGKAKAAAVRRVKGIPQKGEYLLIIISQFLNEYLRLVISLGNPVEVDKVTAFLERIPKVS